MASFKTTSALEKIGLTGFVSVVFILLVGRCQFVESQASVFTRKPPSPFVVLEGGSIFLEWNYTLGSSLRSAEFSRTNTNPATKILILDSQDISNNQPAFIAPLYTGRVQANITASQATVKFLSVNRTDTGNYELHVTRDSDRQTFVSSVTITVQCTFKPENFKFTVSKSTVCQGYVVSFNCSADGNLPVDTYQLLENDTLVSNGSNSLGMWSRNMSTGGVFIYKCVARNAAGTANSTSLTVTMNVPSSIQAIDDKAVTEGRNLTLPCHASGNPPPMVSWITQDGQRVDNDVLELIKISRSEAGEYRCEASNECGNATETASIDVQLNKSNEASGALPDVQLNLISWIFSVMCIFLCISKNLNLTFHL